MFNKTQSYKAKQGELRILSRRFFWFWGGQKIIRDKKKRLANNTRMGTYINPAKVKKEKLKVIEFLPLRKNKDKAKYKNYLGRYAD